ncbi:hypothetical protein NMG60_11034818 [Bertholletia excelsa]
MGSRWGWSWSLPPCYGMELRLNRAAQRCSWPRCLCYLLNGTAASYGYSINQTLAVSLPSACNVQTPPVSQCSASASGPSASAPAPDTAPVNSPNETPETLTTPSESDTPLSGAGSKAVPSARTTSSAGSTARSPLHLAVFLLFIVSCVSPATRFGALDSVKGTSCGVYCHWCRL